MTAIVAVRICPRRNVLPTPPIPYAAKPFKIRDDVAPMYDEAMLPTRCPELACAGAHYCVNDCLRPSCANKNRSTIRVEICGQNISEITANFDQISPNAFYLRVIVDVER